MPNSACKNTEVTCARMKDVKTDGKNALTDILTLEQNTTNILGYYTTYPTYRFNVN